MGWLGISVESQLVSSFFPRAGRVELVPPSFADMRPERGPDTEPGSQVGMVGDAQTGKTSLMVKYVEGSFDEDYIQTLGVNFMEKTVSIRKVNITFSIWDLGG